MTNQEGRLLCLGSTASSHDRLAANWVWAGQQIEAGVWVELDAAALEGRAGLSMRIMSATLVGCNFGAG